MSDWPPIPTNSHPENERFHPVFAFAMKQLLAKLALDDFELLPQFQTTSGTADFVLQRKSTGKIVMPIEIKRTKSDVRGPGRRQARDYQQNLSPHSETQFYCVSNLEITELFCVAPCRKTTISQQVKLSSSQNASLGQNQDEIIKNNLLSVMEEILDIVLAKRSFSYVASLSEFEYALRCTSDGKQHWHEVIMPYCFEYRRGTTNLQEKTRLWLPATAYKANPQRLTELGRSINFEKIFAIPLPKAHHFDHKLMSEACLSGKAFGDGDDFSALVGDILFSPQDGIVETDYELARILGIVAAHAAKHISGHDKLLDPCAGSGRLLAALVEESYPGLRASNIIAIEKEKKFAEALSLRLGLLFGKSISPQNSPTIHIKPLETVSANAFDNVKIAVVNPPFISGINSVELRENAARRIEKISGTPAILNKGQIGYESLFMELLYNLLPTGAVFAFIFPWQVVSRLSQEYAELRKFFITKLGLSHIVTFPMDGVFRSVVKKTAIFIGTKDERSTTIKLTDIQIPIANVDTTKFKQFLAGKSECYGVVQDFVSTSNLLADTDRGWKPYLGIGNYVKSFVDKYFAKFNSLFSLVPDCRRGTMGNKGNTGLTVNHSAWNSELVPEKWRFGAVNKAHRLPKLISSSNVPNATFIPPSDSYDKESPNHTALRMIVDDYIQWSNGSVSSKRQKTKVKKAEVIMKDLFSDQRGQVRNAILLPRGTRQEAKLAIVQDVEVLVSTNFFILPCTNNAERFLLASWLQSVFGQLQLEYYSSSQEGMRKLEKNTLKNFRVPYLHTVAENIRQQLIAAFQTESFLDLSAIKPRNSDAMWAKLICPTDSVSVLSQAVELLQLLYDERQQ